MAVYLKSLVRVEGNMDFGLDEKDAAIIAELCKDSRISVQSLAKTIGFPRVTVHDRIKKMQAKGIIDHFTLVLSREKMGMPLHAFIQATYDRESWQKSQEDRRDVAKAICQLPYVIKCHIVTGDWDYLIEVVASGMDALGDAILDSLTKLQGVGRTHTMVSFYDFDGPSRTLG